MENNIHKPKDRDRGAKEYLISAALVGGAFGYYQWRENNPGSPKDPINQFLNFINPREASRSGVRGVDTITPTILYPNKRNASPFQAHRIESQFDMDHTYGSHLNRLNNVKTNLARVHNRIEKDISSQLKHLYSLNNQLSSELSIEGAKMSAIKKFMDTQEAQILGRMRSVESIQDLTFEELLGNQKFSEIYRSALLDVKKSINLEIAKPTGPGALSRSSFLLNLNNPVLQTINDLSQQTKVGLLFEHQKLKDLHRNMLSGSGNQMSFYRFMTGIHDSIRNKSLSPVFDEIDDKRSIMRILGEYTHTSYHNMINNVIPNAPSVVENKKRFIKSKTLLKDVRGTDIQKYGDEFLRTTNYGKSLRSLGFIPGSVDGEDLLAMDEFINYIQHRLSDTPYRGSKVVPVEAFTLEGHNPVNRVTRQIVELNPQRVDGSLVQALSKAVDRAEIVTPDVIGDHSKIISKEALKDKIDVKVNTQPYINIGSAERSVRAKQKIIHSLNRYAHEEKAGKTGKIKVEFNDIVNTDGSESLEYIIKVEGKDTYIRNTINFKHGKTFKHGYGELFGYDILKSADKDRGLGAGYISADEMVPQIHADRLNKVMNVVLSDGSQEEVDKTSKQLIDNRISQTYNEYVTEVTPKSMQDKIYDPIIRSVTGKKSSRSSERLYRAAVEARQTINSMKETGHIVVVDFETLVRSELRDGFDKSIKDQPYMVAAEVYKVEWVNGKPVFSDNPTDVFRFTAMKDFTPSEIKKLRKQISDMTGFKGTELDTYFNNIIKTGKDNDRRKLFKELNGFLNKNNVTLGAKGRYDADLIMQYMDDVPTELLQKFKESYNLDSMFEISNRWLNRSNKENWILSSAEAKDRVNEALKHLPLHDAQKDVRFTIEALKEQYPNLNQSTLDFIISTYEADPVKDADKIESLITKYIHNNDLKFVGSGARFGGKFAWEKQSISSDIFEFIGRKGSRSRQKVAMSLTQKNIKRYQKGFYTSLNATLNQAILDNDLQLTKGFNGSIDDRYLISPFGSNMPTDESVLSEGQVFGTLEASSLNTPAYYTLSKTKAFGGGHGTIPKHLKPNPSVLKKMSFKIGNIGKNGLTFDEFDQFNPNVAKSLEVWYEIFNERFENLKQTGMLTSEAKAIAVAEASKSLNAKKELFENVGANVLFKKGHEVLKTKAGSKIEGIAMHMKEDQLIMDLLLSEEKQYKIGNFSLQKSDMAVLESIEDMSQNMVHLGFEGIVKEGRWAVMATRWNTIRSRLQVAANIAASRGEIGAANAIKEQQYALDKLAAESLGMKAKIKRDNIIDVIFEVNEKIKSGDLTGIRDLSAMDLDDMVKGNVNLGLADRFLPNDLKFKWNKKEDFTKWFYSMDVNQKMMYLYNEMPRNQLEKLFGKNVVEDEKLFAKKLRNINQDTLEKLSRYTKNNTRYFTPIYDSSGETSAGIFVFDTMFESKLPEIKGSNAATPDALMRTQQGLKVSEDLRKILREIGNNDAKFKKLNEMSYVTSQDIYKNKFIRMFNFIRGDEKVDIINGSSFKKTAMGMYRKMKTIKGIKSVMGDDIDMPDYVSDIEDFLSKEGLSLEELQEMKAAPSKVWKNILEGMDEFSSIGETNFVDIGQEYTIDKSNILRMSGLREDDYRYKQLSDNLDVYLGGQSSRTFRTIPIPSMEELDPVLSKTIKSKVEGQYISTKATGRLFGLQRELEYIDDLRKENMVDGVLSEDLQRLYNKAESDAYAKYTMKTFVSELTPTSDSSLYKMVNGRLSASMATLTTTKQVQERVASILSDPKHKLYELSKEYFFGGDDIGDLTQKEAYQKLQGLDIFSKMGVAISPLDPDKSVPMDDYLNRYSGSFLSRIEEYNYEIPEESWDDIISGKIGTPGLPIRFPAGPTGIRHSALERYFMPAEFIGGEGLENLMAMDPVTVAIQSGDYDKDIIMLINSTMKLHHEKNNLEKELLLNEVNLKLYKQSLQVYDDNGIVRIMTKDNAEFYGSKFKKLNELLEGGVLQNTIREFKDEVVSSGKILGDDGVAITMDQLDDEINRLSEGEMSNVLTQAFRISKSGEDAKEYFDKLRAGIFTDLERRGSEGTVDAFNRYLKDNPDMVDNFDKEAGRKLQEVFFMIKEGATLQSKKDVSSSADVEQHLRNTLYGTMNKEKMIKNLSEIQYEYGGEIYSALDDPSSTAGNRNLQSVYEAVWQQRINEGGKDTFEKSAGKFRTQGSPTSWDRTANEWLRSVTKAYDDNASVLRGGLEDIEIQNIHKSFIERGSYEYLSEENFYKKNFMNDAASSKKIIDATTDMFSSLSKSKTGRMFMLGATGLLALGLLGKNQMSGIFDIGDVQGSGGEAYDGQLGVPELPRDMSIRGDDNFSFSTWILQDSLDGNMKRTMQNLGIAHKNVQVPIPGINTSPYKSIHESYRLDK